MNEINKQNFESNNLEQKNSIANNVNYTKDAIKNTIAKEATEELAKIFWLNKEQIIKLTSNEVNEISNWNEVNKNEAQLAKMFWKYNELMKLENKQIDKPISIASVMKAYDDSEYITA